jgi:hypothetical protein
MAASIVQKDECPLLHCQRESKVSSKKCFRNLGLSVTRIEHGKVWDLLWLKIFIFHTSFQLLDKAAVLQPKLV